MEMCQNCSNREICVKHTNAKCEHYDVAFTRSEVINMIMSSEASLRGTLLKAIERTYKVKMAF